MEIEYVIKCSCCYHLLPLNQFAFKYRIINDKRIIIKKKTCNDCSYSISLSNKRFIDRHGKTKHYYKKDNDLF